MQLPALSELRLEAPAHETQVYYQPWRDRTLAEVEIPALPLDFPRPRVATSGQATF